MPSTADHTPLDGSPSRTAVEIASQPDCWRQAAALADGDQARAAMPAAGERVAVIGCGTSWFIAQSYARLRESSGLGETDAYAASEFPTRRHYDRVVTLSRSGTTSEVLTLLAELRGTTTTAGITGDPNSPIMEAADGVAVLDFADETSVVQTRFATSALAFLRAHIATQAPLVDAHGRAVPSVASAAADATRALTEPLPAAALDAEQFTFLGRDWTCGLAAEAGLKMREAAGAWTESYPAMEYRHGPISITGPNRVAWAFGSVPEGLDAQVRATGGTLLTASDPTADRTDQPAEPAADQQAEALDPMADLVRVQRLAVVLAERTGYDPDRPRNLTRSVVLS